MADLARLSVHAASFPELDLDDLLGLLARAEVRGVGLLRDFITRHGLREVRWRVRDSGLEVTSLSYGGFFTAPDGAERRRRIDDTRRAVDEAAALEARCLLVVAGGLPPDSRDLEGARHMVEDALAVVVDHAAAAGVRLALEPHHPLHAAERSVLVTLSEARHICDAFGRDAPIGLALDLFHQWWAPDLLGELEAFGGGRILLVQLADWPRGLLDLRARRLAPGEGVIDLPALRRRIEQLDYDGPFELEVDPEEGPARRDPPTRMRTLLEAYALRA